MPGEAIVERVQMLAGQWLGPGGHDDMAAVAVSAPRADRRARPPAMAVRGGTARPADGRTTTRTEPTSGGTGD
ncbi:hypothetical protein ABT382_33705 [Streptomyces pharetrae]